MRTMGLKWQMRTKGLKWASVALMLAVALAMSPSAFAGCIPTSQIKPSSWSPQLGGVHLLVAGFGADDQGDNAPSIVGMWHVVFTATSMNGAAVNMQVDNAVVVWHNDGTEIMNSDRPAQDGNFCLGVWKRTGRMTYLLNHIPWAGNSPDQNSPATVIGPPQAGAQLLENVRLSPDGKRYSGTFSLQAYDGNKNPTVLFKGQLEATRITPDTSVTTLF